MLLRHLTDQPSDYPELLRQASGSGGTPQAAGLRRDSLGSGSRLGLWLWPWLWLGLWLRLILATINKGVAAFKEAKAAGAALRRAVTAPRCAAAAAVSAGWWAP